MMRDFADRECALLATAVSFWLETLEAPDLRKELEGIRDKLGRAEEEVDLEGAPFKFVQGEPLDADTSEKIHKLFLRQLTDQVLSGENNPAKFPRSECIADDRVLLMLTERGMKLTEAHEHHERMDLLLAEAKVLQERIFIRLREVYPHIAALIQGGGVSSGYRPWKGEWYYVSWGSEG